MSCRGAHDVPSSRVAVWRARQRQQVVPWSHVRHRPASDTRQRCGLSRWLAFAMLLPTPAFSGTLALKITGVPEHIESSVRASLTLARWPCIVETRALQLKRLMAVLTQKLAKRWSCSGWTPPASRIISETDGDL